MILFPNAKINLGLRILRKRPDGYHDISTVMIPTGWSDILEVLPANPNAHTDKPACSTPAIDFYLSGSDFSGNPEDNLCVRAADLFFRTFPFNKRFSVFLHKVIPSGAGLGGGSADAAFTLKALNAITGARATTQQLELLSAQLGSDCPFFIRNTPALAEGRGEQLRSIDVDLKGYSLIVVKPPVAVSTAGAYASITPHDTGNALPEIIDQGPDQWQGSLVNDFESWAANNHPEIANLLEYLKNAGAVYAAMSGSGSAVFALFKGGIPDLSFSHKHHVWKESF